MEDLDNALSKESRKLLAGLIGQRLLFIKHEAFKGGVPGTFQRVGLITDGGAYCLDNPMDWFDNVFCGPEIISHLLFFKVEKEEDLERNMGLEDFRRFPVGETVTDALLVDDHASVSKKGEHLQFWDSTEGVILRTPAREYAFYKANTMWDETVLIYQGRGVLGKMEPLGEHWDVFGVGLTADVERRLTSLKTGAASPLGSAKVIGRN